MSLLLSEEEERRILNAELVTSRFVKLKREEDMIGRKPVTREWGGFDSYRFEKQKGGNKEP